MNKPDKDTSLICRLCRGSGNLLTHHQEQREFWTCPACGGAGVRVMFSPATVGGK